MHKNIPNLFFFIDHYDSFIFNHNTNIGIIYRNYNSPNRETELIKIAKACKKKRYKLFISNDLKLAIKFGGSSIRDFKDSTGLSGLFQNEFKVYNRENKNCVNKNCNGKIYKIFISNRSSFFCKSCQKK